MWQFSALWASIQLHLISGLEIKMGLSRFQKSQLTQDVTSQKCCLIRCYAVMAPVSIIDKLEFWSSFPLIWFGQIIHYHGTLGNIRLISVPGWIKSFRPHKIPWVFAKWWPKWRKSTKRRNIRHNFFKL